MIFLFGCSDDDTPPICSPSCGGCQTCDITAVTPLCVDHCGAGLTCDDNTCVALAVAACEPACGDCQVCDLSGATPTCKDVCADGLSCQDKTCVAPEDVLCSPACGACETCDLSGATPECKKNCAAGLECKEGACIAVAPADPCADHCASCQRCDTSHGVPYCVDNCLSGQTCNTSKNLCELVGTTGFDHSALPSLQGPFTFRGGDGTDLAAGRAVSARCLECHIQAGQDMLKTAHWKWLGDTPNVAGTSAGSVGKQNLINNFCIATPSNEKRCAQCHTGYGYTSDSYDFTAVRNIDCLSCHASVYAKAPTSAGAPDPTKLPRYNSTTLTADLAVSAQSVGASTRATCGRCHFNAGGGDNVKKGDLSSALLTPTAADDVHMGSATKAMTCANCHRSTGHRLLGQGVHLPVSEGRVGCVDCHGRAPHLGSTKATLDDHAQDIACQTCHIPAFSRKLPTKMDWDWKSAGNKTRSTAGTGDGIETTLVDGHTVTSYDALKGDFVWKKNVRPTYAWYDGRVARLTLESQYPVGMGAIDKRINLATPIATIADGSAKIFPFKVMRGRQPVDPNRRLLLVPNLFGAGSFWATIPAAADYNAQKVEDNWTAAITIGARAAGQISATDPAYTGVGTGLNSWTWGYTEMWMGINHEVAPKAMALACTQCHNADKAEWDWTALGYRCDPMSEGAETCGSRHTITP